MSQINTERDRMKYGNFNWIRGYYEGESVYVVGGGPSLKGFDFNLLKGKNKIAINHSVLFLPMEEKDILTVLDNKTIHGLKMDLYRQNYKSIVGRNVQIEAKGQVAKVETVNHVTLDPRQGLFGPRSGGHFGISVALATGASKVYLLGFDGHATGGKCNFFDTDAVKGKNHRSRDDKYQAMNRGFKKFAPYAERIINLNPESFIRVFKFGSFADTIAA